MGMSAHAMVLYGMLVLCGLGAGLLIRRYDLAQREPLWAMLMAVVVGAGAMYLAVLTQRGFIRDWGLAHGVEPTKVQYAIIAGVFEEVYKLLGVALAALLLREKFDELLDGLIYGSLVGMGTAIQESLAILLDGGHDSFLPMTEPVRIMGHLVFGGIGCAGLGWFVKRKRAWVWIAPLGLLIAMGLHSLWDVVAFSSRDLVAKGLAVTASHTVWSVVLMIFGFVVYGLLTNRGFVEDGARCAVPKKRRKAKA